MHAALKALHDLARRWIWSGEASSSAAVDLVGRGVFECRFLGSRASRSGNDLNKEIERKGERLMRRLSPPIADSRGANVNESERSEPL